MIKEALKSLKFCLLFSLLLTISSCAVIKIQSKTSETQKYFLNHQSRDEVQIKKAHTVDFYFWGLLPPKRTVYIEDYYQGEGLSAASSVEIKLQRKFSSYFYSLITLGMYYPVDLEFSLYAKKSDSKEFQFEHPVLEGGEFHP